MQKHRLALALALFAIGGLIASGLSSFSTTTPTTTYAQQATVEETTQQIVETQQSSTQYLTDNLRQQGDLKFNVRWSPASILASDTMAALFADCAPGEFAVSSLFMYENEDIVTVQSFPIAIPDNMMAWLTVAYNSGEDDTQAAIGVVCVGEGAGGEGVNLDASTRTTIQNTINRLISEGDLLGGGAIVNIDYITKIYQTIVQKAVQIVNITGNNNTVNQVINQSANQIVETGGANVNQTIDQNAQQIIGTNATTAGALLLEEEEEITTTSPPADNATAATTTTTTEQQQQETIIEEDRALPPLFETPPGAPPTTEEEEEEEQELQELEEESSSEEEEEAAAAPLENAEVTGGELTDDSDNTPDDGE